MKPTTLFLSVCLLLACSPKVPSPKPLVATRQVPDTRGLTMLWHQSVLMYFTNAWLEANQTEKEIGVCLYGFIKQDSLFVETAQAPASVSLATPNLMVFACKDDPGYIGTAHTHFGTPLTDYIPSMLDLYSLHISPIELVLVVIWQPERATVVNRENLSAMLRW